MAKGVRYWIVLAFTITALCGLIYLTNQQILRIGANDPQIQISEDIASQLSQNPRIPPNPSATVDIGKSLSTYVIIFNDKSQAVYANATLDGKIPQLPPNVLSYTKENGQDRITWQPRSGARSAAVITRYTSGKNVGFVLVGRSLREVEKRESQLLKQVGLGWLVALLGSFVLVNFIVKDPKKTIETNPNSRRRKR